MLKRLMPSRADAVEQARLVADIDKIVSTPVAFMLLGRKRLLKPISTEEYLRFTRAYNEFSQATGDKNLNAKQISKKLHNIFSAVCEDISVKDIGEMTQSQIGAVYALILRTVSGEIFSEDDQEEFEKKTLKMIKPAGLHE